jgi:hypothetical protein
MREFDGHPIHFDMNKRGLMRAHSGVVTWDQFEDYKRFFGCGVPGPDYLTGDLHWEADPPGTNENAIRLARRFLEEWGDEFPDKARNVRWMLEVTNESNRHKSTGT